MNAKLLAEQESSASTPTAMPHPILSEAFLSLLTNAMKKLNGSIDFTANSNNRLFHSSPSSGVNDTRSTINYFLQSFYPFYNFSTFNESTQSFVTCPSIQNPTGNVIAMLLYIIVCCLGLFGNTLVIYVVLRFSKMQTVTNRYILNLAIADECFLIGIPFLITTMYLNEWIFGPFLCKIYMISTSVTQFTSSIFLLIMSADRFIAVCHPISSPQFRTPLVSKVVSIIAWGASGLLMLPVFFFANTIEKFPGSKQMTCNILWSHPSADGSLGGSTFTLYSLVLGFAIPLSLILVFYYLVIKKLQTVGPKNKSKDKKRSHRKVTRLVLTVITVYIICWSPYWVSQIALTTQPPDVCQSKLEITIFLVVGCFAYSNSAINPLIYAFLSDNFKKSFMKACLCARGKDINAQLQIENSIFPRFGRSRGSDKITSIAKTNLQKSKNAITFSGGGNKESEAVIVEGDKSKSGICVKTTTITIPISGDGIGQLSNNGQVVHENANKVQRTPVLHTDL